MSAEELLAIADVVCEHYGAAVRSMAAIVAVAAVTSAHIGGIDVFRSRGQRDRAITDAVRRLEPLTSDNDAFAAVIARVLAD